MKSVFTICHINLQFHRKIGLQLKKKDFAIFFAQQKLDHYLHDSEFVIRTDHKPLKDIMDSQVQEKKIPHWATNICGYNCKIEYIEGKKNVCTDILSLLLYRPSDSNDDNELSGPDITDEAFEVSMIKSSIINPKTVAQYDCQVKGNQCSKEELNMSGFDLVAEQVKDKELLQLKEELKSGKASQAISSKYILLDYVLYYLSKAGSDPAIWLYISENLQKEIIEEYHDSNDHMGIDKTHDAIKTKYYWPNMHKNLYSM